jgi:hypothetical protein
MVTRHIEKNSPTQVNSENIGVQIHPGADKITFDYKWYSAFSKDQERGGYPYFVDSDGVVYYTTADTVVVNDTTYYKVLTDAQHPQAEAYVTSAPLSVAPDDIIYSISGEPGEEVVTSIGTVSYLFSLYGSLTLVDEAEGLLYFVQTSTYYKLNGDYIYNIPEDPSETPVIAGKLRNLSLLKVSNVAGKTPYVDGDRYIWSTSYPVEWTFYTSSVHPVEGDTVYVQYVEGGQVFDLSVVTDVSEGSDYDTTVSYSVTGQGWTDHSTTLTDENNVICHIPRYMYLKFSQDVTITEE